jgi:hypothetical protein
LKTSFSAALALAAATASAPTSLRLESAGTLPFRHLQGGAEKRYILESMGSGGALFDYDGDGDLDVYLVNASTLERLAEGLPGEPNRLFRNDGAFRFTDVTEEAGVGDRGFGQGVAVADVDNDGALDLYLTNYGPNLLYRNNGDGTFSEQPQAGVSDPRWGTSAAFADVDGDGFLDLYVANYLEFDRKLLDRLISRQHCLWKGLPVQCGPRGFNTVSGVLYRNLGDGRFEDATQAAGVGHSGTFQLGVVFSDLDRDGDQDLYLATDSTPNLLFENLGKGVFRDRSLESGAALSAAGKEQASMGIDAGDVNGDGLFDLFTTNFSDDYNTLYLNQGKLLFVDATDLAGLAVASLPYLGWSTRLADLDGDGDLDIFLVNGHVYPQVDGGGIGESYRQPLQVFLNRGDGTFEEEAVGDALHEPRVARGAALGDLDGDRDPDVVVSVLDGAPVILENRLSSSARFFLLKLVGRRSNRDGIGATVSATLAGGTLLRELRGASGYLSHSDLRVYLGMGESKVIESLTVVWPGGARDELLNLPPGELTLVEGETHRSHFDRARQPSVRPERIPPQEVR